MPFITAQLLTRPGPVRDNLGHGTGLPVFSKLTGGSYRAAEVTGWPAARLPLALLAAVVACYEEKLTAVTGKMTWRTDRPTEYSSCTRQEAGAYFQFLSSIGHELSPIEQAIADGVPYTGDEPTEPQGKDDADASSSEADDGTSASDTAEDNHDDSEPPVSASDPETETE
jgi:ParB family transcriptional regulator, chromosome partitioning protein